MNFADALKKESCKTHTENGATAYNSTGNKVLDLFGSIGSLRSAETSRIVRLFEEAYQEDPLLATRCLFYCRDIRGGLGERYTFRKLLKHVAIKHPKAILPNIPLIGEYGRYDDLYELCDTPVEPAMWEYVRKQLDLDRMSCANNQPCSLLAKWLKTADASSPKTRKLGIKTAQKIGLCVYEYKRIVSALRRYINVVETKMSSNQWSQIDYAAVPSRAMTLYRNAFAKHDGERFGDFLNAVSKGEAKINAGTLYPYDLVEKYVKTRTYREDPVVEEQWKAMPDYVSKGVNALVMADTSDSMECDYYRPICSAIGLAIYFAEHNTGAYHNLWMSFSHNANIHKVTGNSLLEKINNLDMRDWAMNTNLERAFDRILEIAKSNQVPPVEMVKSLIIISDMEIDVATHESWSFYDGMRDKFHYAGYEIPNIVFWNVNSRHDIFHADANRKGVQLCSGSSTATFKNLIACIGMTPTEMMLSVLNGERYQPITISA